MIDFQVVCVWSLNYPWRARSQEMHTVCHKIRNDLFMLVKIVWSIVLGKIQLECTLYIWVWSMCNWFPGDISLNYYPWTSRSHQLICPFGLKTKSCPLFQLYWTQTYQIYTHFMIYVSNLNFKKKTVHVLLHLKVKITGIVDSVQQCQFGLTLNFVIHSFRCIGSKSSICTCTVCA